MADLHYEYMPDGVNKIIEEKGNYFSALRMVRWKDTAEFKLDLRKYKSDENGEVALKGYSFMTDEGPSELISVLLEEGYGDTTRIANTIYEKRPDVCNRIVALMNGETTVDIPDGVDPAAFYDPKELIL